MRQSKPKSSGMEVRRTFRNCLRWTRKQSVLEGGIWNNYPMTKADFESEKKGGRQSLASKKDSLVEDHFWEIISCHTAGDPMVPDLCWTCLAGSEIARLMTDMGTPICADTARSMLSDAGLGRRKIEKSKSIGQSAQRNEQFENIARLRCNFESRSLPIISIDGKKKEFLGELYRPGTFYGNGSILAFDHDFPSYSTGKVVPHGIYDVARNVGHLTLGNTSETSQFATDSIALWWSRHGRRHYEGADSMLVLCDSGGSNNARNHIFKYDLKRLAERIGLDIRVAHYPPHCSKFNPIEHRYFCHVTRAWSGMLFTSIDVVTSALRRVWTSSGLSTTYAVLNRFYQLKRKPSEEFLMNYPITFDAWLPQWNYVASSNPMM